MKLDDLQADSCASCPAISHLTWELERSATLSDQVDELHGLIDEQRRIIDGLQESLESHTQMLEEYRGIAAHAMKIERRALELEMALATSCSVLNAAVNARGSVHPWRKEREHPQAILREQHHFHSSSSSLPPYERRPDQARGKNRRDVVSIDEPVAHRRRTNP